MKLSCIAIGLVTPMFALASFACSAPSNDEPVVEIGATASHADVPQRIVSDGVRVLVRSAADGSAISRFSLYVNEGSLRYRLTMTERGSTVQVAYLDGRDGIEPRVRLSRDGVVEWDSAVADAPSRVQASLSAARAEIGWYLAAMGNDPLLASHYNGERTEEGASPRAGGAIAPSDVCSDVCSVVATVACAFTAGKIPGITCGVVSVPVCHSVCDSPNGSLSSHTPCGSGKCDGYKTCTSCRQDCGVCHGGGGSCNGGGEFGGPAEFCGGP